MSLLASPPEPPGHANVPDVAEYPDDSSIDPPLVHIRMSWDDYLASDWPYKEEWIDGEVIRMMAPARIRHNYIAGSILYFLRSQLPHLIVLMDSGLLVTRGGRVPDLIVLDRLPTDEIWTSQPPLVALEVLSPSTRRQDLVDKAAEYLEIGVGQYWIADPFKERLEIRRNSGNAWETIAVIDAEHPMAYVQVGDHGTVHLARDEIFA